jgi:hypothetical protein
MLATTNANTKNINTTNTHRQANKSTDRRIEQSIDHTRDAPRAAAATTTTTTTTTRMTTTKADRRAEKLAARKEEKKALKTLRQQGLLSGAQLASALGQGQEQGQGPSLSAFPGPGSVGLD